MTFLFLHLIQSSFLCFFCTFSTSVDICIPLFCCCFVHLVSFVLPQNIHYISQTIICIIFHLHLFTIKHTMNLTPFNEMKKRKLEKKKTKHFPSIVCLIFALLLILIVWFIAGTHHTHQWSYIIHASSIEIDYYQENENRLWWWSAFYLRKTYCVYATMLYDDNSTDEGRAFHANMNKKNRGKQKRILIAHMMRPVTAYTFILIDSMKLNKLHIYTHTHAHIRPFYVQWCVLFSYYPVDRAIIIIIINVNCWIFLTSTHTQH